ncbi:MAG: zinc ribbon domain-containing protein [Gemmatimonadetes bacterium]|nr:zinc ribbon domain-containing protein [Gemmatimonadota bacterium]MCB9504617.1 zinc ribbon domain-containing protein [Gemmatimonadales bacterium]MCA9761616.1 zinc ribbon domain-containing protein [Gemmatimonadota bacterium]MCA9768198.1 zinc ribbon domain-containing protein [Gemmatimonadota bacterium]HPF60663.1 zinc ribbon domain-containing protein [Gemmatimonadales bacterium]
MTDLERFAAVLLSELQAEGVPPAGDLAVGSLLDRTFPYRVARRTLALDTVEDYEMLVLRLVAEEGAMVVTAPGEAAEMARSTLATRVPDLDVLRLLRSATITFTDDTLGRLDGVRLMPRAAEPAPDAPDAGQVAAAAGEPEPDDRIIPIRRSGAAPPPAAAGAPACWQCQASLPTGRTVNFCVACGADQRAPTCGGCGTGVERGWRHCPECGHALAPT